MKTIYYISAINNSPVIVTITLEKQSGRITAKIKDVHWVVEDDKLGAQVPPEIWNRALTDDPDFSLTNNSELH